jgi:hypothetical protein
MTPYSLVFRLLLYRMARNGDCSPVLEQHSRYRKEFLKSLTEEERCLCSRKIPHASLLSLAKSPWRYLLASQMDKALITMTGFDGASFASLLQKFAPLFDNYTPFDTSRIKLKPDPSKGGCPRKICPEDCLCLVLVWMCTRGPITVLQLISGMTSSNLCMYLRFGCRIIVEALKNDSLAKICIPSTENIAVYKQAVSTVYPLLSDVWCTMDGLKLYLQQSGNTEIQACFYNGWTHGHYVTSVLFFALTVPFPLHFSMFQDPYTTAKLHIGGGFTRSLAPCTR